MCEKDDRKEVSFSDVADSEDEVTPEMVEAAREAFALSDYLWSGLVKDWPGCAKAIYAAMYEAKKKKTC